MQVTRLPRDPGPSGWNALLPEAAPPRRLEEDITADWLVIGAGFAGLAAARRLRQIDPAGRIVVLEAARVAHGPAGRNSGFMIDLPHDLSSSDYGGAEAHDLADIAANRHAIIFAREMAKEFNIDREAFDKAGKINGATSEKGDAHNQNYARHLARLGEAHEWLDAAEMRRITGTAYYRSGLYTAGSAMLQPAKYVRAIADGLAGLGVSIFEFSPVLSLRRRVTWQARTPKGKVDAPRVVLAVNGHLNSFGHMKRRLMHVFTYASMTRALTADEVAALGGEPRWGLTPADPMGTTVRRISGTGGDRIVVRNRFTFDPGMEVGARRLARVARDHHRAYLARFPMLGGVAMEYVWGGRLCLSRNAVQVVRSLDRGLYSACCQNGLGTAKGTLAGLAAAELAADQPSDQARALADAALPRKLPPGPVAWAGANLFLRWQEMRAGREL